jgi:creatinine amidohydrolase
VNYGALVSPQASLAGRVAILPTGACEAHGPHLPLDTDVRIAVAMAERAAVRLDAVVLPPMGYGVTRFARNFPGTISVEPETVTSLVASVLGGALAGGARVVALANAHFEPAQIDALFAACARVREVTGSEVVFPNVASRRNAARLRAAALDGHSGRYETALMLAIAPDLVRGHGELPAVRASLADGIVAGATCFEEAGGPLAYFGEPARATAQIGEALLDELAMMLVEAVGVGGL